MTTLATLTRCTDSSVSEGVWSVGVCGGVVCSYIVQGVPPPPPPGYMLEVDSKKRPHAACTRVAVLDHNHTAGPVLRQAFSK